MKPAWLVPLNHVPNAHDSTVVSQDSFKSFKEGLPH